MNMPSFATSFMNYRIPREDVEPKCGKVNHQQGGVTSKKVTRRAFLDDTVLDASSTPCTISVAGEHETHSNFVNTPLNWLRNMGKRSFAYMMEYGAELYDKGIRERKQNLFSTQIPRDRRDLIIADIGIGTGPNLKYLPPNSHVIGVEPNQYMWDYAYRKAHDVNMSLQMCESRAEEIPLDDSTCDVVISTLTLCSVESPSKAISEIGRVLKPGGVFLFIEHVVADDSRALLKLRQNLFNPFQMAVAGNCHLTRDTERIIREAGDDTFAIIQVDHFDFDIDNWVLRNISLERPHISGFAIKKI